jgi:hypothetical protein
MKHSILAITILLSIAGSASVFSEEQAAAANPVDPVATATVEPAAENPGTPPAMHDEGKHGKGQGCMMRGSGRHGKGQGGMMHGGGRQGKRGDQNDRQAEIRLDLIEARLARIEAMLEILVRR